jgi:hypothetical protein
MWKRLNNTKGARQSRIGDPVLQETTLDGKDYPGLGIGIQSPSDRNMPPQRPDRGDAKGLPSLPL